MTESHGKLMAYVNSASDLAESLRDDLKDDGGQISPESIKALARFWACAEAVSAMLDLVRDLSDPIN